MYVHTTTQIIIPELSVSDIYNCCVYPLIHTVISSKPSQILILPSCPHKVNSSKPSQPLLQPSCAHTYNTSKPSHPLISPSLSHTFNSRKPSNHYFHRPTLTQTTPKSTTTITSNFQPSHI